MNINTSFSALVACAVGMGCMVAFAEDAPKAAPGAAKPGLEKAMKADADLDKAYQQLAKSPDASGLTNSSELAVIRTRREQVIKELAYIQSKIETAKMKYIGAAAGAKPDNNEVDYWKREIAAWEARLANAKEELQKMDAQESALTRVVTPKAEADIILPGEMLQVYVAEDSSFNNLYQVRRGGYIIVPAVGRIQVAGKSLAEGEAMVKASLEKTQIKSATVMVERPSDGDVTREGVVYLAGQFFSPGPFSITSIARPTLVTTILRSGGVTENADLEHVKLLRLVQGRPLTEVVSVQSILDGKDLASDLTLNENDIIIVPPKSLDANVVYVSGNVLSPGLQKMPKDEALTAYSAILRVGGFARFADEKKVFILRDGGQGMKVRIPVSIRDVKKGLMPDVVLKSGDIVVVPEKFFSF